MRDFASRKSRSAVALSARATPPWRPHMSPIAPSVDRRILEDHVLRVICQPPESPKKVPPKRALPRICAVNLDVEGFLDREPGVYRSSGMTIAGSLFFAGGGCGAGCDACALPPA